MLAMPWIFTGFAVFQSFIQTSKGWGPYVIAQSFMSYSILSVLTLFPYHPNSMPVIIRGEKEALSWLQGGRGSLKDVQKPIHASQLIVI